MRAYKMGGVRRHTAHAHAPPLVCAQMVVRADARERRVAGMRGAVSWLGIFYLIATAVACMMLLMLNVPPPDFWKTFYFWRFFLTPLNVLFGGLVLQLAASTCGCESQPSIIASQ